MNTSTNKSIEMLEAAKFDQFTSREAVFSQVREIIENELDYTIVASDETRPWGGFSACPIMKPIGSSLSFFRG